MPNHYEKSNILFSGTLLIFFRLKPKRYYITQSEKFKISKPLREV